MSTMFPTRAEQLNIKPRVLAARTKKSLASLRERIKELSAPWIEIDNSIDGAQDALLAAFDQFEKDIDGSIEWLGEDAPR